MSRALSLNTNMEPTRGVSSTALRGRQGFPLASVQGKSGVDTESSQGNLKVGIADADDSASIKVSPSMQNLPQDLRARSTPGTCRAGLLSKAGSDNLVLAMVRKQLEETAEKMTGQVTRAQLHNDQLHDFALSRVDTKMINIEEFQTKVDRRLAELGGNYKGLTDEMQAQIRRVDDMDTKIWDWRHQIEDSIRLRFADLEESLQRLSSSIRIKHAANEDALKRQNQRILDVEDRFAAQADVNECVENLGQWMKDVEQQKLNVVKSEVTIKDRDLHAPRTSSDLEARVLDICRKEMDELWKETNKVRTDMTEQEQQFELLQNKLQARDENHDEMNKRLRRLTTATSLDEPHRRNDATFIVENDTATLVQLKDVAPRVFEQEKSTRDVIQRLGRLEAESQWSHDVVEKLGRLEAEWNRGRKTVGGSGTETFMARLDRLERIIFDNNNDVLGAEALPSHLRPRRASDTE